MDGAELPAWSPARKLAWLVALGGIFLCSWVEIIGLDTWWHLAIGRSALELTSTLPTDIFSYSFYGAPWPYKDLAAAVLLYLGYHSLGLSFFFALKGLFVATLALLFLGQRRADALLGLSIFALLLPAIAYNIVDRPLLFSLAFLPWTALLLERVREASRDRALPLSAVRARLVQVLVLLYLGTLLHRGTLVSYGLFAAVALESLAAAFAPRALGTRFLGGPVRRDAALVTSLGALFSPLLALATPSGMAFFITGTRVPLMPALRARVTEWQQLPPAQLVSEFPLPTTLAVLALAAWVGLRVWRRESDEPKPSVLHPALIVLFAGLCCTSVRWVPQLSLYAAVLLLTYAEVIGDVTSRWPERTRLLATTLVGVALLTGLASHYPLPHGFRLKPEFEPIAAMRFARDQRLGPRMANAFNLGGYPLWAGHPEQRVLIDGRSDQIYPSEHMLRVLTSEASPKVFAELEKQYGFDWVIACNRPGQVTHAFLSRDPAWWLVHYSEPALVYVRADRYPQLAPLRFFVLDPIAPEVAVMRALSQTPVDSPAWRALDRELERAREASPLGLRVLASSALFFHHSGARYHEARDRALGTLLREHDEHPVLAALLARFQEAPIAPGAERAR